MDYDKKLNNPSNTEITHYSVEIPDAYLSQNCIEKCINKYLEIKNEPNPVLNIIALVPVIEVDPLLIGYFILFKKQLPTLNIILDMKHNTYKVYEEDDDTETDEYDDSKKMEQVVFKTMQYGIHAIVTSHMKELFTLIHSGDKKLNITTDIPQSQFVWSKHFIPVTFINENSFKSIFINKIEFSDYRPSSYFNSNKKNAYRNYRNELYKELSKKGDRLSILAQLAFYTSLNESNVLTLYLFDAIQDFQELKEEEINNQKIRVGAFSTKIAIDFYKTIKSKIIDQLISKAPIYGFIYATLLSSNLFPKGIHEDKGMENFRDALINLWIFTQQLVDGLQELAKNIYQHSSEHYGVITGRIFNGEKIQNMHNGIDGHKDFFNKYIDPYKDEDGFIKNSFFEINVIDNGNLGVIGKLKAELPSKNISEEEIEDLSLINDGSIKFQNFLDPSIGFILNQQAKRSSAHLGLLIFSNLIKENNGFIRASTWELNCATKRDTYLWFPTIEEWDYIDSNSAPLSPFGTNYHFLLPLNPEQKVSVTVPIKYELPAQLTADEMKDIVDLLSYEIKDFRGTVYDEQVNADNKYLFFTRSNLEADAGYSRQDEIDFWNEIIPFTHDHNSLIKKAKPKKKSFVCLDLNGIEISSSHLFRLLGRWELQYAGCPLIIFNISTSLFADLTKLNKYYFSKLKNYNIPYWNENSIVLFYNFTDYKGDLFYFVDALWGNTRLDFLLVNHLIQKTNYNTTIFQAAKTRDKDLENILNNPDLINWININVKLLSRFGLFQNGVTLLPFDLLLTAPNGLSFFENNATVLLKKDLILRKGCSNDKL